MQNEKGYTLIELMLVVALMAILAAICIPTMGTTISKAKEAATLANLNAMRMALSTYHDDHGTYPAFPHGVIDAGYSPALRDALVPTYLREIPQTMESGWHHPNSNKVGFFWNQTGQADDEAHGYGAGWRYDGNPADKDFGTIRVLCTHKDLKGRSWSTY